MPLPGIANDDSSPHRAVVWIEAGVYQMLKTGECAAKAVHKIQRFPIYIDGPDRFISTNKLLEFIEEVKSKCNSKTAGK